jgi:hypothetical protein
MKPYEIFLNESLTVREILNIYLKIRQHLQEIGFSDNDLKKPPTYTQTMMDLFSDFGITRSALLRDVNAYGFDMTDSELTEYLKPLLEKINELTPLSKDGYNKGRDNWDED